MTGGQGGKKTGYKYKMTDKRDKKDTRGQKRAERRAIEISSSDINVDISSHGPCGLKIDCPDCINDVDRHDENEIVNIVIDELKLDK